MHQLVVGQRCTQHIGRGVTERSEDVRQGVNDRAVEIEEHRLGG
jgi:hypothetical protein